jgi:S1-C subfamily serine protease
MDHRRRRSRCAAQQRPDGPSAFARAASVGPAAIAALAAGLLLLLPMRAGGQQLPPPSIVTGNPSAAVSPSPPSADISHLQGLNDYLDTSTGPVEIAQLGILARDGYATVEDGHKIAGVTVIDVAAKGAVAKALGSHEVSHMVASGALVGAALASAVLFPPALIGVVMLAQSRVGMSYDLVVGVDGHRVRNTMELMQSVGDAHPGDTIYLAIVRRGRRVQVPVHLQ